MRAIVVALALLLVAVYAKNDDIIPDSYIVVFQHDAPEHVVQRHLNNLTNIPGWTNENGVKYNYRIKSFVGYAATIRDAETIHHLSKLPEVRYIQPDSRVEKYQTSCSTQFDVTWGIGRITTPIYQPVANYIFPQSAGAGAFAYVIDTGIQQNHNEFKNPDGSSRVILGAAFGTSNTSPADNNGHGTHVAGTIIGNSFGIAKSATAVAVKVLDRNGSGTTSDVIAGINWVASDAAKRQSPNPTGVTCNLSLGGSYNAATNEAITKLVQAGVFTAVAAGNSNDDACKYSPASTPSAVTVAASTNSDIRASFSNYGTCVNIIAPGSGITAAYYSATSSSVTASLSGTSMASPHVAGVATIYAGLYPSASPENIKTWMLERGAKVNIGDLKGTPDLLLQQGCYTQ